jgi:hypothetical protein
MRQATSVPRNGRPSIARLGLLWLAGIDMRLTLLAVPPVLPLIHQDLQLDEKGVAALSGLAGPAVRPRRHSRCAAHRPDRRPPCPAYRHRPDRRRVGAARRRLIQRRPLCDDVLDGHWHRD